MQENQPQQMEVKNMEDQIYNNSFLQGNDQIEQAISRYGSDPSDETLAAVLETIRTRMHADGHFLFPVFTNSGAAEGEEAAEGAADENMTQILNSVPSQIEMAGCGRLLLPVMKNTEKALKARSSHILWMRP